MRIWYFCFLVGAAAGLTGMSLGISMGMSRDFTLTPVHAHINLLGWVSMTLYGLYYRGSPRAPALLEWVQVTAATAGFVAMTGGLWLILSTPPQTSGEPAIMVGALLTIGSMALFATVLVRNLARARPGS